MEIKGDLSKRLKSATERAPLRVKEAVKASVLSIWSESNRRSPKWRGDLNRATSYRADGFRGVVENRLKYAAAIHDGSRPHFLPKSAWADPSSSFHRWATEHGINPFLLARSISKKGTKPHPWMKEAFEAKKEDVIRFFEKAAEEIIK